MSARALIAAAALESLRSFSICQSYTKKNCFEQWRNVRVSDIATNHHLFDVQRH